MKILMKKKTEITVKIIFIFLIISSIFSLVNVSSILTDETVEIDEPKNILKSGDASHLLDGLYLSHGVTDVGGDIFPSNIGYTLIPSDLNDILSSYSAPSILTILFDESHSPLQFVGGGYSEFAAMLIAAGHIVDTIDSGPIDATVLSGCNILVIVCSQDEYTTAELNAIETWVQYGGSLLLISDWGYIGTYVDLLAARFGFDFKNDAILDSDDDIGGGNSGQNYYDGPNILSHPITIGVSRVEMYAGDGLIAAPIDEIPIIITDTDGTATWYGDATPAIGVSIMSAVDGGPAGSGKVVVIGDSNLWDGTSDAESDGVVNFYDSDNEILASNTINWLIPDLSDSTTILFDEAHSPMHYIGVGYSEFAGMITDLGYTVDTIDAGTVINATVLSECDILIIVCSQDAYTTAELDVIETWVQNGGNLLLITDWGVFGTDMDPLAARFGFDFMNDALLDSDDGVGTGDSSQLFYNGTNILSHPITAGVTQVESYAGDGLSAAPGDETPIIITDTDGTATWYYDATPALGVSVMSVVDDGSAGAGKVVAIGDSNLWGSTYDTDGDGEIDFYDSDNDILARNTINWFISTTSLTILFDETHSPSHYIGGSYSEFAEVLTTAGHTIDTINVGTDINATVLSECDILVIACSHDAYTTAELDAIETWVQEGGSLLLITEWNGFGTDMDPLAACFGFDFKNDGIEDSDDSVGTPLQLFYDGPNILSHPITTGVSRVEMYGVDGLIAAPFDETPIIITDTDGTATWHSDGSPAFGVSVMSVVDDGSAGAGKVVVIGDCSLWTNAYDTDSDGVVNFYDSDNDILAMNTINWLAPAIPDSLNVTSPDSSNSWETGTTNSITWTSTGSITNVKIELYEDGAFVLEIVASTANDGGFSWMIPSGLDNSTQYQINISDVSNPDTYDLSNNFEIFTIPEAEEDSITVTNPSTATAWEMGTSHAITWTSTGSITTVKIELFKDGVFVLEIVANTANDGSYTWAIPTDLEDGIDYQIKISDVSNPATYDESPNFAITSIDIPEDGDGIIPSYNLYIIIGIISVVSAILFKNRKKIKTKYFFLLYLFSI